MDACFTPRQLQDYRRDGFLVVRGLFNHAAIQEIAAWTDELAATPEQPGRMMMYFEPSLFEPGARLLSRIENFYPYHADFARFLSGELCRFSGQLLGAPAVLFKEKINFKLPGADGFKPHQDVQAGWDRYASAHLTALIGIDPATRESGCLELVAGAHQRGLIGVAWQPLDDALATRMPFTPCETLPGDAIFFDSFTPHRSAPNHSPHPRRVLYATYNRHSEGDHRIRYYRDKRASYPPDCEREPGKVYVFRV